MIKKKMKKAILCLSMFAFLFFLMPFFTVVNAANESAIDKAKAGFEEAGIKSGLIGDVPFEDMIGRLLGVLIAFLGLFMLILVVYGGITWMTAGGDSGAITKAKQIITNGAIGLAICLLAYSFTYYVVTRIGQATLGGV